MNRTTLELQILDLAIQAAQKTPPQGWTHIDGVWTFGWQTIEASAYYDEYNGQCVQVRELGIELLFERVDDERISAVLAEVEEYHHKRLAGRLQEYLTC